MRHWCAILAFLAVVCLGASAQDIYQRFNGSCQQGGAPATVNGVNSKQNVQISYPACTITVFAHGAFVLVPLFSDAAGNFPLANPFTATSTGTFGFYAANGRYDVTLSGAGIPTPFTISDVALCFNCASGAGLSDPGSNGPVKRTALDVTAPALATDMIGLWGGVCDITTWLRADGQCATPPGGGVPGGAANSIQFNNGAFSGVSLGAGQMVVGTSGAPIAQNKSIIDARDVGVDCTGASNSDVVLNALTGNPPTSNALLNGKTLVFPMPCNIHLANTWLIKNQSAFVLSGYTRSGANGGPGKSPTFTWTGAADGTVIEMEYVDGFKVEGLAVNGANLAANGIVVDKTGAGGTVNTTDGIFQHMTIHSSASGGAGNANWVGINISPVSTANVEDIRIEDSSFFCGVRGGCKAHILIGHSANAKNEIFKHNNFTFGNYGVWARSGSFQLLDSELSSIGVCTGAGSDIRIDENYDAVIIQGNLDENGAQFLNINEDVPGGQNIIFPIRISDNHFAPAGCENLSKYWINIGVSGPAYDISNNGWNGDANLVKVIGNGNTGIGNVYTRNNLWPNATPTNWWTMGGSGPGLSSDMGVVNGSQLFVNREISSLMPALAVTSPFYVYRGYIGSSTNTPDDFGIQALPATGIGSAPTTHGSSFLIQHQQGTTGNSMFSFDGFYPGISLAPMLTQNFVTLVRHGTAGTNNYTYAVVPYYGSAHAVGSATATLATGNATLDTTNYNEIQFGSIAGATKYCIWRTATDGTPSSTGMIGCINALLITAKQGTVSLAAQSTFGYAVNGLSHQDFYTFSDTGLAGDSAVLPSTNTTSQLTCTEGANSASLASSGTDVLRCDITSHRWIINNNNGGDFIVPGLATPGTVAHMVVFAANGIDLVDGGAPLAGGTVTNTGGNLALNAVMLGAGIADSKVSTGITSDGGSELDLGVNASTSGVLGLKGSTSGTAKFTAPAIAGTVTNPVTSSNTILVPDGIASSPAIQFSGAKGLYNTASGFCWTSDGSHCQNLLAAGSFKMMSGNSLIWSNSTTDATAPIDANLWRPSPGVIQAGTIAQDTLGTMRQAESDNTGLFGSMERHLSAICETAGAPTALSLSVVATTTGLSCLPAKSIIDAVVYRITTGITGTTANFTIGDGTVAGRFCGTETTLTLNATGTCFVQADQTGTGGPRQGTAAAVVVTTDTVPTAGAIRLIVFYHTWTAPTS